MSTSNRPLLLGVNVDHIATLREARGVDYPDPKQAADIARSAGADGITVHLREDRRHIQDHDVFAIKESVKLPLNLEMAAMPAMQRIALEVQPAEVCLVPEKRDEVTTEGGLDVLRDPQSLRGFIAPLIEAGTKVSVFIDPEPDQIKCARDIGASIIELHTGEYANAQRDRWMTEFARLEEAAELGVACGLQVNAGHGLHYQNVQAVAGILELECLNIGHAIVSRAALTGMHEAVMSMKQIMIDARLSALSNGEDIDA